MANKTFISDVITSSDYSDIPHQARFTLNDALIKRILDVSELVKTNNLYKVEISYQPEWLSSKDVRIDSGSLNVTDSDFWFSAIITNTDVEIITETYKISDLPIPDGLTDTAYQGRPFTGAELLTMTHQGNQRLSVVLPIELGDLIDRGIEALNDLVSEMITTDSGVLVDITYEAVRADPDIGNGNITNGTVYVRVSAMVDIDYIDD